MPPRLRLELRLLLRGWVAPLGVALIVVTGVITIAHGHRVIAVQNETLARSPALQADEHRAILGPQPADALAGDQSY